jgi:hypothetical protein
VEDFKWIYLMEWSHRMAGVAAPLPLQQMHFVSPLFSCSASFFPLPSSLSSSLHLPLPSPLESLVSIRRIHPKG